MAIKNKSKRVFAVAVVTEGGEIFSYNMRAKDDAVARELAIKKHDRLFFKNNTYASNTVVDYAEVTLVCQLDN